MLTLETPCTEVQLSDVLWDLMVVSQVPLQERIRESVGEQSRLNWTSAYSLKPTWLATLMNISITLQLC